MWGTFAAIKWPMTTGMVELYIISAHLIILTCSLQVYGTHTGYYHYSWRLLNSIIQFGTLLCALLNLITRFHLCTFMHSYARRSCFNGCYRRYCDAPLWILLFGGFWIEVCFIAYAQTCTLYFPVLSLHIVGVLIKCPILHFVNFHVLGFLNAPCDTLPSHRTVCMVGRRMPRKMRIRKCPIYTNSLLFW